MEQLQKFYDEMMADNHTSYKKKVLERYKDCKPVVDLVCMIYDPFLTWGVTSDNILKNGAYLLDKSSDVSLDTLKHLLWVLAKRKLTRESALWNCYTFYCNSNAKHRDLILKIFDKNLKIGVDTKTINEVWGNIIPTFDVSLAFDYNKSSAYPKRVERNQYLILRKLDGVRCIAIVKHGEVKCYSRVGNEYTTLNRVKQAILSVVGTETDVVFDGELCVIDNQGTENFKQAVSEVRRKDYEMEHPHYKIFDMLSILEFQSMAISEPYSVRLTKAHRLFKNAKSPFLSVLGAKRYSVDNFTEAQTIATRNGWEGLILRADCPYRSGRSSDLLKVKKFVDAEYVVEDILPTNKPMQGLDGLMHEVKCMGAIVIRHKGNPVKCGTGFTDAQRIAMWNNPEKYLGRKVTVKYFEETTDNEGNPSLRFPTFVGFRDTGE